MQQISLLKAKLLSLKVCKVTTPVQNIDLPLASEAGKVHEGFTKDTKFKIINSLCSLCQHCGLCDKIFCFNSQSKLDGLFLIFKKILLKYKDNTLYFKFQNCFGRYCKVTVT